MAESLEVELDDIIEQQRKQKKFKNKDGQSKPNKPKNKEGESDRVKKSPRFRDSAKQSPSKKQLVDSRKAKTVQQAKEQRKDRVKTKITVSKPPQQKTSTQKTYTPPTSLTITIDNPAAKQQKKPKTVQSTKPKKDRNLVVTVSGGKSQGKKASGTVKVAKTTSKPSSLSDRFSNL